MKVTGNARRLGQTDLEVGPMAYGLWRFVGDNVKAARARIEVALEAGMTLIDVAAVYGLDWGGGGFGESERLLGKVLADARAGTNSWKGKQTDKPLLVANYYPNVWQLVVPQDSDVRKLADLKGKAVALPPRGNTSLAEGWELLLKVSGMKLDDLGTKSFGSISENAELVKNRQAVAMGWYTTVPASFVLDLGSARKLRMVPVSEDVIAKMRQVNHGFARYVVPKGVYEAYGIDEEVVTIQAPTILIASSKTPADVIYKVTKAIVEGRENFANVSAAMKGVTAKHMAESFGLPHHPGAERYYKEAGLLN